MIDQEMHNFFEEIAQAATILMFLRKTGYKEEA